MDVAMRRLSFGDLSLPVLQHASEDGPASDLAERLQALTGSLEGLSRQVDGLKARASTAAKLQGEQGGVQAAKQQLAGVKRSLLALAQKDAFLEVVKLAGPDDDFHTDVADTTEAVDAAEQVLKNLKRCNKQDEEELKRAVKEVSQLDEQYTAALARATTVQSNGAQKVSASQVNRQPPADLARLQAQEAAEEAALAVASGRAQALEEQLARAEAVVQDLEGELRAQALAETTVQAEIVALVANKGSKPGAAVSGTQAMLEWYQEVGSLVTSLTSVSIESIGEDQLHLRFACHPAGAPSSQQQPGAAGGTFRQSVAGSQGGEGASQGSVVGAADHVLTVLLHPGTSRVIEAHLVPPSVSIAADVVAAHGAEDAHRGLIHLITAVRYSLHSVAAP